MNFHRGYVNAIAQRSVYGPLAMALGEENAARISGVASL
jgi:hypothetical protein